MPIFLAKKIFSILVYIFITLSTIPACGQGPDLEDEEDSEVLGNGPSAAQVNTIKDFAYDPYSFNSGKDPHKTQALIEAVDACPNYYGTVCRGVPISGHNFRRGDTVTTGKPGAPVASYTKDPAMAKQFAGNGGTVFVYQGQSKDISSFSPHPDEKECLVPNRPMKCTKTDYGSNNTTVVHVE